MVGNIVTGAVTNKPTMLQIALGVVVREKTYDEVLRFKSSAAHAAAKSTDKLGISCSTDGLVQVVADNFDANISSPNSVKSTHALAILVTQPQHDEDVGDSNKIKWLKKEEMSSNMLPEVPVQTFD